MTLGRSSIFCLHEPMNNVIAKAKNIEALLNRIAGFLIVGLSYSLKTISQVDTELQ